ncbi:MAG: transporter substrate-binding domain-containing protein [Eubacterium sp.]|jgi:ABC-type amino acid transport/signal transduction systems, periplasmic component/domain|nr:transporter substrate-binding domain-containing protein [Eubacterium sp.]
MKKLIVLSLTMMLSFSLAACGSSDKDTNGGASKETTDTGSDSNAGDTSNSTADDASSSNTDDAASDGDLAYVKDKGTLVVGITDFEPMDYKDADGNWIGFDADMAKAFAESLGVTAEFVEIDWDNKIMELDGKTIDCVWNGMTLLEDVKTAMECTNAYCNNAQVVIVAADKADLYQDVESLKELNFAVETGSAGEDMAQENNFSFTPVQQQSSALMEVAAGTADAAIIDSLMAAAMVGEGTGYANLTYTVQLNSEEYGVGFRKGSNLAGALNDFFAASYADGSMMECAEKYGVQAAVVAQ